MTSSSDLQPAQAALAAAGPESVVRARQLTIAFDLPDGSRQCVVSDVSLDLRAGEFLVLIGRSGCGKTTLLNAIAGLVEIESGELSVLGGAPRSARAEVGYMFARDALMPWRTACRNVEFSLQVRGMGKPERRARALEMLDRVHLRHAAQKLPWQLSQGMRQRVALARTWVSKPRLLLMDEPFAALDAQTKTEVRAEFVSLWAENKQSVVFVTHDITEALLLADRVLLIKGGRIDLELALDFPRPRVAGELLRSAEFQRLAADLEARLA